MGEEMESKGAMDGPRYESKGAMQRFMYGFGLKIVVGRRSVGDGHGAWGRTSIWAWGPRSAAGAGESRRRAGARGTVRGRGRCSAREREERARGSGVEGARRSEGGGDGREGEGAPDPWKRWTTPQCARGLVSSASVEA